MILQNYFRGNFRVVYFIDFNTLTRNSVTFVAAALK